MLEKMFLNCNYPQSNIPVEESIPPETSVEMFLAMIKNYEEKCEQTVQFFDEEGNENIELNGDYFYELNNLYGLFFVNLWSNTEIFLVHLKNIYLRLSNEKDNPKDFYRYDIKKNWFEQRGCKFCETSSANQVRILCNNFKHNGQLDKILQIKPKNNKKDKINRGWVRSHCKNETTGNIGYSDLDIKQIMFEVGNFCNETRNNLMQYYKTQKQ